MLIETLVCPECRMDHRAWIGNGGEGYAAEGKLFCCEGCYAGTGCECEAEEDRAYEQELRAPGVPLPEPRERRTWR
jgi:hypothetical protein